MFGSKIRLFIFSYAFCLRNADRKPKGCSQSGSGAVR